MCKLVIARTVSIHAPLARSNRVVRRRHEDFDVSIHAPLARSNGGAAGADVFGEVSIHAPLARSNIITTAGCVRLMFQYMLLLRGATRSGILQLALRGFNTCSSCEEQLIRLIFELDALGFNTCSSCEEQLVIAALVSAKDWKFQYMLLLRGATLHCFSPATAGAVSIHAPLARSNKSGARKKGADKSFNTCSSCEEQRLLRRMTSWRRTFQYMLLLRGATTTKKQRFRKFSVSIHAPLARSNRIIETDRRVYTGFQYMLLLRGATSGVCVLWIIQRFQYMLLLRGATFSSRNFRCHTLFQYMLLLRGATRLLDFAERLKCFNTCSSCEEQLLSQT